MLSWLFPVLAVAHLHAALADALRPWHDPALGAARWRALTAMATAAAAATVGIPATVAWTWVGLLALLRWREALTVGIPPT